MEDETRVRRSMFDHASSRRVLHFQNVRGFLKESLEFRNWKALFAWKSVLGGELLRFYSFIQNNKISLKSASLHCVWMLSGRHIYVAGVVVLPVAVS